MLAIRRKVLIPLALAIALIAGSANYSPREVRVFKQKVSQMQPTQRKAMHRWFVHLAFAKWLRGLSKITLPHYGPAYLCGYDLPPCYVMLRESSGDPTAVNPTGCSGHGCYGKWQFDPTTWDAVARRIGRFDLVGRYLPPALDQDAIARALWANGAGCGHWAAC